MKKNKPFGELFIRSLKKTLLIMRIAVILMILGILQARANDAYSQKTMLSLNFSETPLVKVLDKIEDESEFFFLYNEKLLDTERKVSIDAKDQLVSVILDNLFAGTDVKYTIIDRKIILAPDFLTEVSQPQQNKVTGTVTDKNGPIPGANVVVTGTTQGTITDIAGKYSIEVPQGAKSLTFSFVGMVSQEISIGTLIQIDLTMAESAIGLEEVVVVGYGTQRKQDVTGSITSVKVKNIVTQGSSNVQKALQGQLAGVQVESAGGDPGAGVRILIRGTGSLNNNNPLYIVDGVQVGDINNLSSSDIASIDILKDASAAAIYGSRASNGVVLVTTTSGRKGENKIVFNAYTGIQKVDKLSDVLNASEWAKVSNAAHDAAGLARLDIANNPDALGEGTNWQKEIYRVAPMQNYTLDASGGGNNFTYSISGGYLDQQGIVKTTDYNRVNLRIKSDFTKGRVKIGETVILSQENRVNMSGGWGGQGGNAVGSSRQMIPVFQVYDPTAIGGYGGAFGPVVNIPNPVALLNLEIPKSSTTNLIVNAFAEVSIIEGLKYKFNLGYTNTFGYNYDFVYPYAVGTLFVNKDADLSESRSETDYFLQEHTLNYNKAFGKHNINALIGFTFQDTKYRVLTGSKSGMPPDIQVIDAGITSTASGSNASESALLSYLGRLIYSYNDRYVITGTFRRDGSSRFGPANKYGDFPSIAIAWNVSNERFFEHLHSVVSSLKLRSSYGVLGNQEISNYQYTPSIAPNTNYVIGQDQHLWPGSIQTSFSTPNIKWESSKTINVGYDIGFFKNKLSFTGDYFIRKNTDILVQVPIPLSTGGSAHSPYMNAGQITNKGFEAVINYSNSIKDFTYQLMGTFSSVKNKIDYLGTGTQQIFGGQPTHHDNSATVTQAGLPIGAFYLIKTVGIFNSQEEINAYTDKNGTIIQPIAKPGDVKFVDANGDGKIDQNDRVYCGSPTPTFSYGFGGNAGWKGFDISIYFQGTYGNKIYSGIRQDSEGMNLEMNYSKTTLNAWTPTNHTNFPRAVINDPNLNSQTSDRFLENGSYLRLKTLQIGYILSKSPLSALKIASCRFYVSFDNLFTITKYSGFNPDLGRTGSVLDRGVDYGHVAYPLSKTSMVGLQLSF